MSLRSGTFFEQSRLQLRQWIVLMYWWAREYPVKDAAEEAEVDEKTAIQIYQTVVICAAGGSSTMTLL